MGPCVVGLGDCDGNKESEAGLVWRNDFGASLGSAANSDVCEAAPLPGLGSNHFCTLAGSCGVGEGDCDGHHECQAGLVFHNNLGENHGFASSTDVCELPVLGNTNYFTVTEAGGKGEDDFDSNDECVSSIAGSNDCCSVRGPCGVAEGGCDGYHECEDGLVCSSDVGANYGYHDVVDVCEVGP